MTDEQPNKPGGDFKSDGETRKPGNEQAVKNQAVVSPENYPDPASSKDIGGQR